MKNFLLTVRGLIKNHPYAANTLIYGSLYVGAEFSQQYVSKRILADELNPKEPIDYGTIGRYAVMGGMVFSPSLITWYKWLDRAFPGTTKEIIVKKLILDQFVLSPYLLTVFYTGMSLMERVDDTFLELREKFVPTFIRSCVFWLPAQALNFLYIAPRYRVIYMGFCGFVWVNILCLMKRKQIHLKEINNNIKEGEIHIGKGH